MIEKCINYRQKTHGASEKTNEWCSKTNKDLKCQGTSNMCPIKEYFISKSGISNIYLEFPKRVKK